MLSLRLVALLLFLVPLVCPKPRPAHYLIETEDGQADHSADGDDAADFPETNMKNKGGGCPGGGWPIQDLDGDLYCP